MLDYLRRGVDEWFSMCNNMKMARQLPLWILEAAQQVAHALAAERVLLFGSFAQADESRHSDVDLFVVAHTPLRPLDRIAVAQKALAQTPRPVDVIVYTPEELRTVSSKFIDSILRSGIDLL